MTAAMYFFGILTVITASGVILARSALNSALWLVVTLFLVAVHFALLGADFIAATQVLVYAGAIMVLVVFVIMLIGIDPIPRRRLFSLGNTISALVTGGFVGTLVYVAESGFSFPVSLANTEGVADLGSTASVGKRLFENYLFGFEIASLLLLAAIIGAVVIAKEPKRPFKAGRGLKAVRVQKQ